MVEPFVRATGDGGFGGARWKEKVLVLCSRGTTFRFRHLMQDLLALLPHSKQASKLDTKSDRRNVNEMAELKGCTASLLFEVRKHRDLYMWLSKIPEGPSIKFHVTNVHTMDELKLTGNHMRGTRSLLSFSEEFGGDGGADAAVAEHYKLMKELFVHVFGVPRGHRRSKPFYDHVLSFTVLDDRVWVRNFQIIVPGGEQRTGKASLDEMSLAEVGPRMCLNPIKIFTGSHSGASLFSNPRFMTPTAMRIEARKDTKDKYNERVKAKQHRKQYMSDVVDKVKDAIKADELRNVFRADGAVGADDDDDDDDDDGDDDGAEDLSGVDDDDDDFDDDDHEFDDDVSDDAINPSDL